MPGADCFHEIGFDVACALLCQSGISEFPDGMDILGG